MAIRALVTKPHQRGSTDLELIDEPRRSPRGLLVETLQVGVCGIDRHIIEGSFGTPPSASDRLILGHESLGRVVECPWGSAFSPGDLVVGITRRPDPVPCSSCKAGEWDMCENGRYVEAGIKEMDGYAAEFFALEPEFAVRLPRALERVGVLLEPASFAAKAWAHIERIGLRIATWHPRRALVTGAGPVALLAALVGVQRGIEVCVFDRHGSTSKKDLVQELGAEYMARPISELDFQPDVLIECTGLTGIGVEAMVHALPNAVMCLTGISSGEHRVELGLSEPALALVRSNDAVFAAAGANRQHYLSAADALGRADTGWLDRLITRRLSLDRWPEVFQSKPDDIKAVLEFAN